MDGTQTCQHNTCPTCSMRRAMEKGDRLARLLTAHLEAGGSIVTGVLSISHTVADRLSDLYAAVKRARQATFSGRPWQGDREAYGIVGSVWHREVTRTANGWHVHIHYVLVLDGELSDDELAALDAAIFGRYRAAVEKGGRRAVHEANGLQRVRTGAGIAQYVAKSAALEATMGDRKPGSVTPFQVLQDYVSTGDMDKLKRFNEFEQATKGDPFDSRWSNGLADLYDLDAVELPSDGEEVGEMESVFQIETPVWYACCDRGLVPSIMALVEERRDREAAAIVQRVRDSLAADRRERSGRDDPGRYE